VQAVLAVKLLHTAITHGMLANRPEMPSARRRMGVSSAWVHALTGLFCLAAAFALTVPQLLRGIVTSAGFAESAGAVLWLAGLLLHRRTRDKPNTIVSLVLFVLAAFVAYGYLA
jgi:hypothetical protein